MAQGTQTLSLPALVERGLLNKVSFINNGVFQVMGKKPKIQPGFLGEDDRLPEFESEKDLL